MTMTPMEEYVYLRAWGQLTGSSRPYIDNTIIDARDDGAPIDVYRRGTDYDEAVTSPHLMYYGETDTWIRYSSHNVTSDQDAVMVRLLTQYRGVPGAHIDAGVTWRAINDALVFHRAWWDHLYTIDDGTDTGDSDGDDIGPTWRISAGVRGLGDDIATGVVSHAAFMHAARRIMAGHGDQVSHATRRTCAELIYSNRTTMSAAAVDEILQVLILGDAYHR